MARVEFSHRILKNNLNESAKQSQRDRLRLVFKEYLETFSSKPGFFYELIHFKDLFASEAGLSDFVLDVLKNLHDANKEQLQNGVKSVFTCLSYYQMHRYFGKQSSMSLPEMLELATEIESMYTRVLANFGKDLPPTTFQYADDFIILATHLRYDALKIHNHSSLLSIILNLKLALANSPSNFQIKILLLNLYSHIGAYDSLQKMYESMEIKNIQHYSTANLLMTHNIRLAAFGTSNGVHAAMSHFFTSNLFDIANFLVNCYKFGSLTKAFELCEFMDSVSRSLTMNLSLTNAMSIQLILNASNLPSESTTNAAVTKSTDSAPVGEDEQIENELRTLKERLDKHLKELQAISGAFQTVGASSNMLQVRCDDLVDHMDKEAVYQWDCTEEQKIAAEQYNAVIEEQKKLFVVRFSLVKFLNTLLEFNEGPEAKDSDKVKETLEFYKNQIANTTVNVLNE